MAEYDEKETKAQLARHKKHGEIAKIQKEQLSVYKQKYIDQLYAEKEEGVKIAEQCKREIEEDRNKGLAIRATAKANMVATM